MNPTVPLTLEQPPIDSRQNDKRPTERGSAWASFFVSVVVHINLLLILAMTYHAFQKDEPPPLMIDSTFTPGEEDDNALTELPNDVVVTEKDTVFSDAAPLTADEMVHAEQELTLAGLSGQGGASGIGGLGAGGGVGFFGTLARGKSFVFVVDCSGSMQGDRFNRALAELRRALEQLEADQTFQIVFFNDHAVPLVHSEHSTELMPATRDVLSEVFTWVENRHASGGTMPDDALKRALRLRPDVVFFLTDADQVPRNVRTLIAESNKHRSTVHTIAFGHRGGETLMQGIADDHHGRYRFVP